MVELRLIGTDGTESFLDIPSGRSVYTALIENHIPPVSVVVTRDGTPVSDAHSIDQTGRYEARLLEGYDLQRMRSLYSLGDDDSAYLDRRLSFVDGDIEAKSAGMDPEEVVDHVESRLTATIRHYDLIDEGDQLVFGLTGGVDSVSLLTALDAIEPDIPSFELRAVTVAEPWTEDSEIPGAERLADRFDIPHRTVGSEEIAARFGLETDPETVFEELSASEYGDRAAAVADHIVSTFLESHAESVDGDAICLGSQSADIIAGTIRSLVTGVDVGAIPRRRFGAFSYVYPLVLLSKRELSLYYAAKTEGSMGVPTADSWQLHSEERSFFYYIAELLASRWPGIEHWLLDGEEATTPTDGYHECDNCGKLKRGRVAAGRPRCEACSVLEALGHL